MIYRRAFFSEVTHHILVVLVVLGGLTALVTMGQLITATGALSATATLVLLALAMIKVTPQLLTVALFAGLVLTFNRMAYYRELNAWSTAGLRDRDWFKATLVLTIPMTVTIWILAVYVAPWSLRFAADYQRELASTIKLEETNPGLFGEIPGQQAIYHLGAISPNRQQALGVFIARQHAATSMQLILGARVTTEIDAGGLRDLIIEGGELHNLDFAQHAGFKVNFKQAELKLGSQFTPARLRLRALAPAQLDASPAARVELLWRHAFAGIALLLALFALPLGRTSPGTGRSYQVVLAIVTYWLFYALCGYAKGLGEQAVLSPAVAAFGPLGLLALVTGTGTVIAHQRRWT